MERVQPDLWGGASDETGHLQAEIDPVGDSPRTSWPVHRSGQAFDHSDM